jgi:hypothetical protein
MRQRLQGKYWFKFGTLEDKRLIVETIGSNLGLNMSLMGRQRSNLVLKDRKLQIEPVPLFEPFSKAQENSLWWSIGEEIRTYIQHTTGSLRIPVLKPLPLGVA